MGKLERDSAGSRAFHFLFRLILVMALCVPLATGCGKKDTIVGPGPAAPKYPELTSPENVLIALKTAYVGKDSTEYKLLFDLSYMGISLDQTSSAPADTFTFADEARHIAALPRSTVWVDLQLKPTMARSVDLGDPTGWALIQDPIQTLTIYDGPNTYPIAPSNETMEFRFIPKTPDSTSPTDTTWKIIRWLEVAH